MSILLSIEIGGTKLQAAAGTPAGRIARLRRCPVPAGSAAKDILPLVARLGRDLAAEHGAGRAVIGFGGPVDAAAGRVVRSFHVPGWDGFPLRSWAEDALALPCAVENDTSCAALAEARLGAGRGADVVFYTNVGTGIGGGLVVGGRAYTRPIGCCEIGHTRLWDESAGEYCIVERLCSGRSLERAARRRAASGALGRVLDLAGGRAEAITAEHIASAAGAGDAAAAGLIEAAAGHFAVALCNVIALLNPDRIVVGGGVSLMGELFFAPLRKAVAAGVFGPYAGRCEIVPSALGETVVLVGGLLLGSEADRPRPAPTADQAK